MRRREARHVRFDFDEGEQRRARLRELRQRFTKGEIAAIADQGLPEDRDADHTPGGNDADTGIPDPVPSSARPLSPPRDGSARAPRQPRIQRAESVCDVVRREGRPGDIVQALRRPSAWWRIRVEAVVRDELIGILLSSTDPADVVDRRVVVPSRMISVGRGRILTFPPPATG